MEIIMQIDYPKFAKTLLLGKIYSQYDVETGEYKEWYSNGQISEHLFKTMNGDIIDGEYKRWFSTGEICDHLWVENGCSTFLWSKILKEGYLLDNKGSYYAD